VYQSKNGDFAEWVRRQPDEAAFEAGDVIGYDEGSLLTRRATGASQVSSPERSREHSREQRVEHVREQRVRRIILCREYSKRIPCRLYCPRSHTPDSRIGCAGRSRWGSSRGLRSSKARSRVPKNRPTSTGWPTLATCRSRSLALVNVANIWCLLGTMTVSAARTHTAYCILHTRRTCLYVQNELP
jgi:hypothetical protein